MPPPSTSVSPTAFSPMVSASTSYSFSNIAPSPDPSSILSVSATPNAGHCVDAKLNAPLTFSNFQTYIMPTTSYPAQPSIRLVIGLSVGLGVGSVALILAFMVITWLYFSRRGKKSEEEKPPPDFTYTPRPFEYSQPGRLSTKTNDITAPSAISQYSLQDVESGGMTPTSLSSSATFTYREPLSPTAQPSTLPLCTCSLEAPTRTITETTPQPTISRPPSYCTSNRK